ncbi:MAG: hypothetical protein M3436_00765 [Pseudomonadota bacterium]|nr:hypothetical protein [Pseudomonadota bacterium]
MKATARRQPAAVVAAIQTLVKLGATHGVEAINLAYAESIAEHMACETRDVWRARITDGQLEAFAQIEAR